MEIQLFNNPQFGQVRTAGTADMPLFCLADICKALDLGNPSQVKTRLNQKEVQLIDLHALNNNEGYTGNSIASFVTESGLYKVIFQSRKPEAEAFTSWVTDEVLPSIRKTGAYAMTEVMERAMNDPDFAIRIFQQMKALKQQNQMLEGEKTFLEQENKILAPKAQYTDDVLQANEGYTFEQMAKQLNFRSTQRFIQTLLEKKICYKRSDTYMLYADYAGKGYTRPRTSRFFHRDGTPGAKTYTVWTEKGRMWLHEKFNVDLQPVDLTMFNLESM